MSRRLGLLAAGAIATAGLALRMSLGNDGAVEVTTANVARVPSLQSLVTASGEIVVSQAVPSRHDRKSPDAEGVIVLG